jgi:hypothetical protein
MTASAPKRPKPVPTINDTPMPNERGALQPCSSEFTMRAALM